MVAIIAQYFEIAIALSILIWSITSALSLFFASGTPNTQQFDAGFGAIIVPFMIITLVWNLIILFGMHSMKKFPLTMLWIVILPVLIPEIFSIPEDISFLSDVNVVNVQAILFGVFFFLFSPVVLLITAIFYRKALREEEINSTVQGGGTVLG